MKEKELKKRGAKPLLEGRNLSFAEIKQRQRAKDKCLHDAMWEAGYICHRVYLHPEQIKELSRLSWGAGVGQFDMTNPTNLSAYLFHLIRAHLKQAGVENDNLPDKSHHVEAFKAAERNYQQWKKQHIESLKSGEVIDD
ncbi:hypothetical protein [Methylomicrobium album]|uniref:Uncharacterized protein n=1 Tax=Methylomicrobium album BG8 TaxID=686340 RepID=H8GR39_METAL|nr:hypothetical protein [Methylomicrobium album]EIC29866.1 hypothetical protein Metal_2111 [Methylomicrobium album BG8]